MASSLNSNDGDVGFQIAPMVDVVFVLMLFFMVSAGIQMAEKELSFKVPGFSRDGSVQIPIVIDIDAAGRVSVNHKVYAEAGDRKLASLETWLKDSILRFGGEDPVVIRPDGDVQHQRIMEVLNCTAKCGVKKLSFG